MVSNSGALCSITSYGHHIRAGSPSITSVLFDRESTTLTCTSTGGPPTSVTWRKNGVPVSNSLYQQSQRVVDTESATYENLLFNDDDSNFVGTISCEVGNVRGTAQDTVELNGELCFLSEVLDWYVKSFVCSNRGRNRKTM